MLNKYQLDIEHFIAKGFTLIELLVVILIIGIVLSVGILGVSSNSNNEIQKITYEVRNTIVKLRNASILDNKVYRLILFKNRIEVLQYQKVKAVKISTNFTLDNDFY